MNKENRHPPFTSSAIPLSEWLSITTIGCCALHLVSRGRYIVALNSSRLSPSSLLYPLQQLNYDPTSLSTQLCQKPQIVNPKQIPSASLNR